MPTLSVSAPVVKPTPAAVKMACTFDELNALPLGAFRRWEAEYRRRVAILTGGASRTFGGSAGSKFDAAVSEAHKLVFDGYAAGALSASCVAAAEEALFNPVSASVSLAGREAVIRWVLNATEPTPDPETPLPTYSDDAETEAALCEARACIFPASDRYRQNMAMLADMADRSAAVRAELDATRANLLAPVDPWDTECDPADWPADPWPTATEIAGYEEAPGTFALPALRGGSGEAEPAPDDDFPRLTSWPYEAAPQRQSRHPVEFEQQEMRGSGAGHPSSEW